MVSAVTLFSLSSVGIIGLFSFKYWELRREKLVAATLRMRADEATLHFKARLHGASGTLVRLWPTLTLVTRYFIHQLALAAARGAHKANVQAHRIADLVSHKHRFAPRPSRSEFLQKVGEVKNGVTQPFDIQ